MNETCETEHLQETLTNPSAGSSGGAFSHGELNPSPLEGIFCQDMNTPLSRTHTISHDTNDELLKKDHLGKKRRKLQSCWENTVFESFFPKRDQIFNQGLKMFYYQSTLTQEGAFYKYDADSYIYGVILYLKFFLLQVK